MYVVARIKNDLMAHNQYLTRNWRLRIHIEAFVPLFSEVL